MNTIGRWPSQVVLTVAQIIWTAQVEQSITDGTLKVRVVQKK